MLTSQVSIALLVALKRPRTCPTALFLYYMPMLGCHLAYHTAAFQQPRALKAAHGAAALAAFMSIFIMLLMPCRSDDLPNDEISEVGTAPTCTLRSPEDNLRMWQFLTVSWMS